jgi:hypothetical protein
MGARAINAMAGVMARWCREERSYADPRLGVDWPRGPGDKPWGSRLLEGVAGEVWLAYAAVGAELTEIPRL